METKDETSWLPIFTHALKRTAQYESHFCQKILQFIKKKRLISPGEKVILAVSGGIDSVVMLDVMAQLKDILKVELAIAHVNHQLRGQESNDDEKFVLQLAKKYRIECVLDRAPTKKIAKEKKLSIQEAARDIRYSFFDTLKKSFNADCFATAHNANDNAETVLMNLFRGSGIEGLQGIPVQRGNIIRPLLCVTRKEISTYAKKRKISFREDSSNLKDDYTRNYLRHKIIPKLEKRINPSLVEILLRESEIVTANVKFVEELVESSYDLVVKGNEILVHQAKSLHLFLQQMVVHRLLEQNGIEPSYESINSVIELMYQQKGKSVDLNKNLIAERLDKSIHIRKRTGQKEFAYNIEHEGILKANEFTFSITKSAIPDNKIKNDASIEYIDARLVKFPITVRSWKKGDSFFPLGMKGKKKLSDFFGEQKLSSEEKFSTPIVESSGQVIWIAGQRLDDRFKITDSTTETYQLSINFVTEDY